MRHKMRKLMAFGAGASAALGVRAAAFAQEGAAATPAPIGGGASGYGLWDWFQIGFRLALVLAVIWGAFIVMRWYMRKVNGDAGTPGSRQLQIVETRALGANRSLHLVRVGGRAVLIGVTPDRINQLMEIDDPEEVERLSQLPPESETRSFRSVMGALSGGLPGSLRTNGSGDAPGEHAETRRSPRAQADGTTRRGRMAGAIGRVLRNLAGVSASDVRRAPRAAEPAREPAVRDGLFDETPSSARALRARSGYEGMPRAAAARAAAAPPRRAAPAPAPARDVNRGSREALSAAAAAAANRPAARPSTSREAQISEIQRAIASARRGLGIEAEPGRTER